MYYYFFTAPAVFVGLNQSIVTNYSVVPGTILDSFGFFDPNPLAVLTFTLNSSQPISSNFAIQQLGPNTGTCF